MLDAVKGEDEPPKKDLRTAIVNELEYTYGPWLVVIAFSIFLSLDPATEVLVSLIREIQENTYWVFFNRDGLNWVHQSSVLGLSLLPIAAHMCASTTMVLCGKQKETVLALGILLFILCFAGYGYGFYKAIWSPESNALEIHKLKSTVYFTVQLGVFSAIYWAFIFFSRNLFLNLFTKVLPIFGAALICVVIYVGIISPSSAVVFSPVAIATGFAITACLCFSLLTIISNRLPVKIPLIIIIVALSFAAQSIWLALFFSVIFGVIAALPLWRKVTETSWGRRIYGAAALLCMIYAIGLVVMTECVSLSGCNIIRGSTPDHSSFEEIADTVPHIAIGDDKPLRIVAAQGGGLYAAYHTAYYLAARTDLDADFVASLYAISGVSGGSVGAGVYWAVVSSGLCPTPGDGSNCHRDAVNQILTRDYLSPSLAAFFFRDYLDTYLPISAAGAALNLGPMDRGHVLEQEIGAAVAEWRESMGGTPGSGLQAPIGDTAFVGRSEADTTQKFPYLFFNGTQVNNGTRALISPVQTLRGGRSNLMLKDGKHLSALNGMAISARFPMVTPPARVVAKTSSGYETIQLVDGGYFDNSGIETALDIMLELNKAGVTRPMHLLIFEAEKETEPQKSAIEGLLGAPISAFTGAWRARRDHSAVRVEDVLNARNPPIKYATCNVTASLAKLNFTVSWFLSTATFQELAVQTNLAAKGDHVEREIC